MPLATLTAPARHELLVKKSRFLAQAEPVASVAEALQFLEAVREPDATHNCWAYRIGTIYRSSDDGEPAGTAGRPILAAIDGQHCDRVMVVVARWFGGIKLGAGGLVRAYNGAASECLRLASRLPLVAMTCATIVCGFDHVASVHQWLAKVGANKLGEAYSGTGMDIAIELPHENLARLKTGLRDATRGQASCMEDPE
ncbi:MAG: YigZ family protein [Proteobacteria bacterium]|nr:YigZ family protein [Pseudomonadota bacterium]